MIVVAALLATAAFAISFKLSKIYPLVLDALTTAQKAMGVMRDDSLHEDEKERLVQQAAIRLLKLFAKITLLGALILSLPMVILLTLDRLKIAPFQEVMDFLLAWEVLLAMTVSIIIINLFRR